MSLFVVDPDRCQLCGACVDECPRYLIEMAANAAGPTPVARALTDCHECGHCVVVCPTGALRHRVATSDDCQPVRLGRLPDQDQVTELLLTRRSVRVYDDRPVAREVLAGLVEVARHAPSTSNRQPVEWVVVADPARTREIAASIADWLIRQPFAGQQARTVQAAHTTGQDLACRRAPHIVIAHTPKGQEIDGIIALATLELAAYSAGLGACWSFFTNLAVTGSPEIREALGIGDDRASVGVMLLGYPVHAFHRVPPRKEAKVTWL